MTQPALCPSPQTLQRCVLGELPEAEAELVEAHLLGCEVCVRALRNLRPDDALVRAMQAAATQPDSERLPERALGGLLQQVKQGIAQNQQPRQPPLLPLGGETPFPAAGVTTGPRPSTLAGETMRALRDVLTPPLGPDELGRFGSYRVLQVLGSGGMGVVFRAEDFVLKRTVALKVMKPEAAARHAARARFLREAQATATLEHEHVIGIYQVGEASGVPFLAMPCLRGETLEERLQRAGPLQVPEVLRLGRQIALGLAAAHERGLIHRDVKPANIWLESPAAGSAESERTSRVKILDFGLARPVLDDAHLTESGVLVGTPAYMAPEQARGEDVSPRCDLFSLGVVLYRMCSGELPFRGANTLAVLSALATQAPRPVYHRNPTLPPALSALVMELLAKDPAKRTASAREVADRLLAIERQPDRAAGPGRRRWLLVAAVALLALLPAAYFLGGGFSSAPEQRVRVTVSRMESKKQPDRPPTPAKDPDRLAAEWALALRCASITIRVRNGHLPREISDVKKLPEDAFQLVGTVYACSPLVDDAALERYGAGMTHLSELNFQGAKIGDAGLGHLKKVAQLTELNLSRTRVGDGGLAHLKGLAQLTDLALYDTKVGDAGLVNLEGLAQLRGLNLGKTQVTDTGLKSVQALTNLKELDLSQTGIKGPGLAHLQGLTGLNTLVLRDTAIADDGLALLQGLPQLRRLDLDGSKIADDGLIHLKALPKLSILSLRRTSIGNAGLAHLGALTGLTTLQLSRTQVGDAGLTRLKRLKNLQVLDLDEAQVAGKGLAILKELPRLINLRVGGPALTDAFLGTLAELKQLERLSLAGSNVSDEGLKPLARLTGLQELDLTGTRVTASGVGALQKALPRCSILKNRGLK